MPDHTEPDLFTAAGLVLDVEPAQPSPSAPAGPESPRRPSVRLRSALKAAAAPGHPRRQDNGPGSGIRAT